MMTSLLLDTNAWAFATVAEERLTSRAMEAIQSAEKVYLCPVSLYEVAQKSDWESGRTWRPLLIGYGM